MSDDVSVRLSADSACRALASDLARRYLELAGGREPDVASFGRAVAAAAEEVVNGDRPIDITFNRGPRGIDAEVSCSGRRRQCHVALTPA